MKETRLQPRLITEADSRRHPGTTRKEESMYLTQHFSLSEFTVSREAARRGIDNQAPHAVLPALYRLAERLEVIRKEVVSGALLVNSGYRCPSLNAVVGGQPTSNHLYGLAADIHSPKMHARDLWVGIRRLGKSHGLTWDECLLENDLWVHFAAPAFSTADKAEMKTLEGIRDPKTGRMRWETASPFVTEP